MSRTRGEAQFAAFPAVAAYLYARLMRTRPLRQHFQEIAEYVTGQVARGRLLDVGTGPGWLLHDIHALNPALELYGLDVSPAMMSQAKRNLGGVETGLTLANVSATGYADMTFDAVVCSGSFYVWDKPEAGLEEIHRILKPGCSAHLFENYRDYDRAAFDAALRAVLQGEPWPLRLAGPPLLTKALSMSYTAGEVEQIAGHTHFAGHCQIEEVALAGLPIWMHIQLTRPGPG